MKFCYLDESGTGDEPFAVMVGVIVDAYRMRPTKKDWDTLLANLTKITGKEITELHTKDFYPGNGIWRGVDGPTRAKVIESVLSWFAERKHKIVYTVVDKEKYNSKFAKEGLAEDVNSIWQLMALHICLAIQKSHQGLDKNKGNTLLVFDNHEIDASPFRDIIKAPPARTDIYYGRGKKQDRLDQLIDVPYFSGSKDVGLVQLADFLCYFLRLYVEFKEGVRTEKYKGEEAVITKWVQSALGCSITKSCIYPKNKRDDCADVFYRYAPACIL